MNIKELLGFDDKREFEEYVVCAIIMFLAILCLSYMARNYYMTTFEYIIYIVEIFVTGIVGYKMMLNDEHSILTKIALICFPLTLHMKWMLLNNCLYLGLVVFILLLISIVFYLINGQKHLQIIQMIVIATMILSLAFPLEAVYQLFFDYSILTSDTITISNEIETVMLLEDDQWQTLTMKEKMNVLQTIIQVELNELGVYD